MGDPIKQEKQVELAFENQRWFDLIRCGNTMTELGFTHPNYLLFPVPRSEINATNVEIGQNPGYSVVCV